jgi:hypothetical protein
MRVMLLGHAGVAVAKLRGDDAHGDAPQWGTRWHISSPWRQPLRSARARRGENPTRELRSGAISDNERGRSPTIAPSNDASVAQSRLILPDGFDPHTGEPPDEARGHVEQIARRPAHVGRFVSPCVEKLAAVIEGDPPLGVRHMEGLLMAEARPGVQIDRRDAIGSEARALFE